MKIFRNILNLKMIFDPASVSKGTLRWFKNYFKTKSLQNPNHAYLRFKDNRFFYSQGKFLLLLLFCIALEGASLQGLAMLAAGASDSDHGFEESAREHMMEELGVNEITTPLVGKVFHDLEVFQPPPLEMIKDFNNNAMFSNRLQTALQFGALVADGFVATIARQQPLIIDIGKALIKDANALAAGQKLTDHSKSLFELADRNDWQGLREELNRCQKDVEHSMIELHDGEMADLISLGGWLRGFQMATHVTADHYTAEKAAGIIRLPIIDYFIERMDTLSPRTKKQAMVMELTAQLKTIRATAAETVKTGSKIPTQSDVVRLKVLADEAMKQALLR